MKENEVGDQGTCSYKQSLIGWEIHDGGAGTLNIALDVAVLDVLATSGANTGLLMNIGKTADVNEIIKKIIDSMH